MPDKKPSRPKTTDQINRKTNLLQLIGDDYGAVTQFALRVGKGQGYLWQIKNTSRGVGESFARDIERALGLDPGWLDRAPEEVRDIDVFACQIETEARRRSVPDAMQQTIITLLRSAPLK